ncbi:MAG: cysteine-rich CWC family protein [Chitinophagaceae bacterium]|nr:cysteine-rich CWC family protein [Chitinophagaceae bacterium]
MHEIKICPRCQKQFECKAGSITQCQCYEFTFTDTEKAYIAQRYQDCLCRECLAGLKNQVNFFMEKYFFLK